MSVQLGLFTMPFHHPSRDYAAILDEDREAVALADGLGFSEAYVGEHFTSWSERIADPLMFFSTLVERAPSICFGTGVLNLPQAHPLTVAGRVAQFDHLCRGRFIMGIGSGGINILAHGSRLLKTGRLSAPGGHKSPLLVLLLPNLCFRVCEFLVRSGSNLDV